MSDTVSSPVQLQLINKILATKDYSTVVNNQLTAEHFVGYEPEFLYIKEHVDEYNNVPDKLTFLGKFPEFTLCDVEESDTYLVDKIREELLYSKSVPILQKMAELLKGDANDAVSYMRSMLPTLQTDYSIHATDIIANAIDRYNEYENRKHNQDNWFFSSGFPELDSVMHGIQRKEELVVIFARTNQGKSWLLEKMCTHIWQIGYNVCYISPEMGASSIGYRFDTLYNNISNRSLIWSNEVDGYKDYIEELSTHKNKFIVALPSDFNRQITISKLRNIVKQYKIDCLAVDGITYLSDERYKKGDNKTTSLTNISEDLIELSIELSIPILVVVQANRGGAISKEESGTPELETIRDSDGISHNATKVISMRQSKDGLEVEIKKQRFGKVGDKFVYDWDIDLGKFTFLSSTDDGAKLVSRTATDMSTKFERKSAEDVF